MLLVTDDELVWPHRESIVQAGYGFSVLTDPGPKPEFLPPLGEVMDMLRDWAWTGPPENEPIWMRNNDYQTIDALSKMQAHQQLAFGAACCERMIPNYESFKQGVNWGDIGPLRRGLDTIWKACEGQRPGEAQLWDMLSRCGQSAPDSEDFTSLYTSPAQNAAFAVCALLEFLLDGDTGRIVSVPRFSTDSVDLVVQEQEDMNPQDPFREQKILEHPLMQQELMRQRRDLAEALKISTSDGVTLLALRTRAQRESNLTLAS
jgi:uncharacterized protein YjaG (DUF416 family)